MSFLGGIADVLGVSTGGLLSAGASLLGTALSNSQSSDNAQSAQAFSAQQYATRYQTQVKDMEAAGLNPMLSYMNAPSGSPQGVYAPVSNYGAGLSSAYDSYRKTSADIGLENAQEASAYSTAKLNEAQIQSVNATVSKTVQETANLDDTEKILKQTVLNMEEQRQNLVKEGYNLTDQGNVLRATADRIAKEVGLVGQQTDQVQALAALQRVQSALAGFDVKAAADLGNLGREAGQIKPIFDILRSILRK